MYISSTNVFLYPVIIKVKESPREYYAKVHDDTSNDNS